MDTQNLKTVRKILKKHGKDTLSYFSLQEKREYFFDKDREAFLSFRYIKKTAVVGADPIGPEDKIPKLIKDFVAEMKKKRIKTCFVGLSPEVLPLCKVLGLRSLKIGEEAIIDLSGFNLQSLKKRVRRTVHYSEGNNIKAFFYTPATLPENVGRQIEEIKKDWLKTKKKEYGFSMALRRTPTEEDKECEFIVAKKGEEVVGYLSMLPAYRGSAMSLDSMRRRHDAPNGLMEFLVIKAALEYKKRGYKRMSLNFVTFMNTRNEILPRTINRLQKILFKSLSRHFPIKSLYFFNAKFSPDWQSRYLVFPSKRSFPTVAYAVMKCEGFI